MFIGLDLGTSGLRALLIAENGAVIGDSEASYGVSHPHMGWSEQNPQDWIAACNDCMASLKEKFPNEFSALKGIGLSGQMHGATLIDGDDNVLRPCILWNDTRSHEEAANLDSTENVRELSGNIVFPGFTAPKLLWVKNNEPEIFAKTAKVLLPKDFLRFYLTGEHVGEMSDAAGTTWLNVRTRQWSDELLEKSAMRQDQMPHLVEGSEISGNLRDELVAKWGLSGRIIVAGGGGDNAAAACGVGTMSEGQGFISLGTSGVLLVAKDNFSPMPESAVHSFCHAVPNKWYQMGVMLAATDCLNWLSQNLGKSPAELSALLGNTIVEPGTIQFMPYLSGERTPHNDSKIRGAFLGLDVSSSHKELTQAVMEGVSYGLRDNFEALKLTGTNLNRLLAIGGGSQSTYWVELLATLFNLPIDIPEQGEFGAALGAARLAICAATGASPDSIMTPPKIAQTINPRSDLIVDYEAAYQKFTKIYPTLRTLL
jgi:xylulokinase